MSALSAKEVKELVTQGNELSPCTHIPAGGVHPFIIENASAFLVRKRLVKVGLKEVESSDRKAATTAMVKGTGSILVGSVGETILLYRKPVFTRKH